MATPALISMLRILTIDDHEVVRRGLKEMFTQLSVTFGEARSGAEALNMVREQHWDIAVLDINLEDEAVFPVADALTRQGVPFLFATGYSQAAVPARYQHVPRWEKPFTPEDLAQALPKLMRDC